MKTTRRLILLWLILQLVLCGLAAGDTRRVIHFPDILGYKTLKCDFHIHTVFSDGLVWPTVRVDEAWREGLDAIAITDHVEYQPHKKDIPTNHNRPYEIALARAEKRKDVLLIKGAEITRDTPPGHFNAIFLQDINALDTNDLGDAVKAASQQGGFVFWNHPFWKPEAKGWLDIHTELYKNKWLHGLEVVNGNDYYTQVQQWCLDKNLTMLGCSDIHEPIGAYESAGQMHRPMTLVFATDKSIAAIKDAMFAGRTVVWHKDRLIGKEECLAAIFKAGVVVTNLTPKAKSNFRLEIANNCEVEIRLERRRQQGPKTITLPARTTTKLSTRLKKNQKPQLLYEATNLLIAPDKGLPVELIIPTK